MALDMNDFSNNQQVGEAVYSEKKMRIGIIGTGGISGSHIAAYLEQPDIEIVAGCDLIEGKADEKTINKIIDEKVVARLNGETVMVEKEKVNFVDVAPNQIVSITTSCIPFLEHDDATRALMGANMQRQAVPLLTTEAPIVGTGMEYIAARDSGSTVVCKADGVVEYADGKSPSGAFTYNEETANLLKYANQDLILEIISVVDNFERAIKLDDNNLTDDILYNHESIEQEYMSIVTNEVVYD